MKVPYIDLPSQFEDPILRQSILDIFENCQFVLGEALNQFEQMFAKLCGTRYALGLNSGTDAIFLALKALGVGGGDEVITVSNSFVASAGAIVAAGAVPVFIDIQSDYNMDVSLIENAITKRTKVILPVHLTGNPADMKKICEIAKNHNLYVIEDAAQAVSASIEGKAVGSFGDAGCFSLHPLKNLNIAGDGGMLTTNSEELYTKIKKLRNHGLKNRDEIEFFGYNSRLDTLQAIIANHGLANLEKVTEKRQKNASIYDTELKNMDDHIIVPQRLEGINQVFHTYVIQVRNRAKLIEFLYESGVDTKIHYPVPIHLQKPSEAFGYKQGDFPICEKQSESILSLPVHQWLTGEQVYFVIDLMKKFYR